MDDLGKYVGYGVVVVIAVLVTIAVVFASIVGRAL